MQQSIQDALREPEEEDSKSGKNPKAKDADAKRVDSARDVLAALKRASGSVPDDDASQKDKGDGAKSHFSAKAFSDYLHKNRQVITAAVDKERGKRKAAAARLTVRKPVVNSPRYQALTELFGKGYEGEEEGDTSGSAVEARIRDEL